MVAHKLKYFDFFRAMNVCRSFILLFLINIVFFSQLGFFPPFFAEQCL